MSFDEGLIVTENDSTEFAEFILVDFGLLERKVVEILRLEIGDGKWSESRFASCSHLVFINKFLLFISFAFKLIGIGIG